MPFKVVASHPPARPLVWLDVQTTGDRPDALHVAHLHAHKIDCSGSHAHLDVHIHPAPAPPALSLQQAAPVLSRFLRQCDLVGRNGGVALVQDMGRAGYEVALSAVNVAEVLEELMAQQATFTAGELASKLRGRLPQPQHVALCQEELLQSTEVVALGLDPELGVMRYTTASMLACERRLLALADGLAACHRHPAQVPPAPSLTPEQQRALVHVAHQSGDLAVISGYAGVGKSTMLSVARAAWEAAGYRVRGAALAGKAAEELDKLAGIEARTVASLEWAWRHGKEPLQPGDILVVDEASMIGTRMLVRLLEAVAQAGAKLVLVGDVEQLPAIEAGAPLRAIAQRVGEARLECICRQTTAWMRAATLQLAQNATAAGLHAYAQAGHLHPHATHAAALQAVANAWDAAAQAHPQDAQLMLAYRRADVQALNQAARQILQARGQLQNQIIQATDRGPRAFAAGDRMYFLRNDRRLGVRNGSLGTVLSVQDTHLTVQLDGSDRPVCINTRTYPFIDHGYAATVHKAQGATVDRCHVLASALFDRNVTYVALSRHRQQVDLHWGADIFADVSTLAACLGRAHPKELALDYLSAHGTPVATPEHS